MHGKRVHVHGELAKNEAHPPQHAPAGLNYAAVAKEEMDDVAVRGTLCWARRQSRGWGWLCRHWQHCSTPMRRAAHPLPHLQVHPPPVKLMSGKATGVEQWDKVRGGGDRAV